MRLIEKNLDRIQAACIQNQVSELYVFGSVLTGKLSKNSDIDLLVDIDLQDPIAYGEAYFNLKEQLETILHRKVDLLETRAIHNQTFKQAIDKFKKLVYARRSAGVAGGY